AGLLYRDSRHVIAALGRDWCSATPRPRRMEHRLTDKDRSAAATAPRGEVRPRPEPGLRRAGIEPVNGLPSVAGPAERRISSAPTPSRRPRGPLYAALDLGTNNCRL